MELADFHQLADALLEAIEDQIIAMDDRGIIDTELHQGVLTITVDNLRDIIVNKHTPTRQVWLSSPFAGGIHFCYDDQQKNWYSLDGKVALLPLLAGELSRATKYDVHLNG